MDIGVEDQTRTAADPRPQHLRNPSTRAVAARTNSSQVGNAADYWAQRLGVDRSELLRDALRLHDVAAYAEQPLSPEETSLADIADWAPAHDRSDWADATG